jgi:hypothetical protein
LEVFEMATREVVTALREGRHDPRHHPDFITDSDGKRLRYRQFSELMKIAMAHEVERDPRERWRLEAKFKALLAALTPRAPMSANSNESTAEPYAGTGRLLH